MWPTAFGYWLDHPCRTPSPDKARLIGDRWQCRFCGRVWVVELRDTITHFYRYFKLLEEPSND